MNATWSSSKRVRMDSLKRGQRFLSIDGETWTYIRRDGASSGVHHVGDIHGNRTMFAGCAEVVLLDNVVPMPSARRFRRLGSKEYACAGCGVVVDASVGCEAHPHAGVVQAMGDGKR